MTAQRICESIIFGSTLILSVYRIMRHIMSRGCPVDASTLLQSHPSGSIFFFLDTAREIGTWVNSPFQKPTTIPVRPAIPA